MTEATTTVMQMNEVMSNVSTIVTSALSWITSFVTAITANPLILAFVIVAFVGLGVGLISRLIHL